MTINEFNHFNKTLDVLSVFSNQDESAKSFFETFLKSSKDYPNLKVSRPVVYESSQYKKSDAFQVNEYQNNSKNEEKKISNFSFKIRLFLILAPK